MTKPFLLFESGLLSIPGVWDGITKKLPPETQWYVNDRGAQSAFDAVLRQSDYPSVLTRLRKHMPSVGLDSPIIVVGHSVGALLARAHANALGARVGGLVLIDPAPPAQFERGVDQVYHYLRLRQSLALQALRSMLRIPRTGRKLVDPNVFPESARKKSVARCRDRHSGSTGTANVRTLEAIGSAQRSTLMWRLALLQSCRVTSRQTNARSKTSSRVRSSPPPQRADSFVRTAPPTKVFSSTMNTLSQYLRRSTG